MSRLTLSLSERIILANQLRILEAVDPDEAKSYAHIREALTNGYELDYGKLSHWFEDTVITVEACKEVYDILEMHRARVFSYRDLEDKTGIHLTTCSSVASTATRTRSSSATTAT